jgi:histidinol-phosphate aminotransferase
MGLSRRDLLAASALVLSTPKSVLAAAPATKASASSGPVVLCWNENPYGPGPAARAALRSTVAESCRYPDADIQLLIDELARHERTGSESVVIGTGSGELLCALGMLYGRDAGEIIAAQPTYAELTDYAKRSGAALKLVPVDSQLRHDLAAMRSAVGERTRAIYLCNPNNPTGTALTAAAIRSFVQSAPDQITTIIDEAYMDFADGEGYQSAVDLVREGRRVVVLRTFSKIHGMAGVRCGYAITRPDIAAELASARMSSPSILAVRAARASLGDRTFLSECRGRILASRKRITAELGQLGLTFAEPQGNFVYFDTGMPLAQFNEQMRQKNVMVGRLFPPFGTWCRITIGTEPEVEAFLHALHSVVGAERRAA